MFERFTNQSRRAVVLAQEEARLLNHNYIGTEHLLAGLRHEDRGAAAKVLKSADITLAAVRGGIEATIGRGQLQPSGHIPFTPRAKKSLELSLREALQLGHNYIGTGHLLLGLISREDCTAVRILGELGADLGQLRTRVIQELESQPEDSDYSPPLRLRRRSPQLSEPVQGLLDTIDDRLSAIERHLGIARPGEQAAQPDAGNAGPGDAGNGGSVDAENGGSGEAENGGSGEAENGGSGEAGVAAG